MLKFEDGKLTSDVLAHNILCPNCYESTLTIYATRAECHCCNNKFGIRAAEGVQHTEVGTVVGKSYIRKTTTTKYGKEQYRLSVRFSGDAAKQISGIIKKTAHAFGQKTNKYKLRTLPIYYDADGSIVVRFRLRAHSVDGNSMYIPILNGDNSRDITDKPFDLNEGDKVRIAFTANPTVYGNKFAILMNISYIIVDDDAD